jgi:hypothetical protein
LAKHGNPIRKCEKTSARKQIVSKSLEKVFGILEVCDWAKEWVTAKERNINEYVLRFVARMFDSSSRGPYSFLFKQSLNAAFNPTSISSI